MMDMGSFLRLGGFAMIAGLGCGTADHPGSATHNKTEATTPDLIARAEKSLAASWLLDYQRPFTSHDGDRPKTTMLYLDACRAGDKSSCWVAATLDGWTPKTTAFVHDNCLAGDLMSCRALPRESPATESPVFAKARGRAGRSAACDRPPEWPGTEECDVGELRRECVAGFPHSCRLINTRANNENPDREQLHARFLELAREGCRVRIDFECGEQFRELSAADRLLVSERMCPIGSDWCGNLSGYYRHTGAIVRARDFAEQACQYGGDESYRRCLALGQDYINGDLPEPISGRGEALSTWGCNWYRMKGVDPGPCKDGTKRP